MAAPPAAPSGGTTLRWANIEQPGEPRPGERLVSGRPDVAKDQLTAGGLQFVVQGDEPAESGSGGGRHRLEVEAQLAATRGVDEPARLQPDSLDQLFPEYRLGEPDHGSLTAGLDQEGGVW